MRAKRRFALASAILTYAYLGAALTSGQTPAATEPSAAVRTGWGDPNVQGVWDFRTLTPLERPDALAGKEFLGPEEAAAFLQETLEQFDMDRRDGAEIESGFGSDVERAYNQFWWDFGTDISENRRTSLIVDPADGKIPWTPKMAAQLGSFFEQFFGSVPEGPEDRALGERCILGFNSGPPMLPSAYNNNVHLLQTPDHVVILNEMVHNARIVPLRGQQHLPASLRQWVGDSRGRWEGDTLVVETINFRGQTSFQGSSDNLHLIERFTRVDADRLVYEFTVNDPETWTMPWTVAVPMKRSDARMFEYACHEGNYGMVGILAGARAQERQADPTTSSTGAR